MNSNITGLYIVEESRILPVTIKNMLNPNFRKELRDIITNTYLNKTLETGYVLDIDLTPVDNELPLYRINDNNIYEICLKIKKLIFNVNDIIEAVIEIRESNIYAFNSYVLCKNINLDKYVVNYSKQTIQNRVTKQTINNYDNVKLRITEVFSSDGNDKILCNAEVFDEDEN